MGHIGSKFSNKEQGGQYPEPVRKTDSAELNVLKDLNGRLMRVAVFKVNMTFVDGYLNDIKIAEFTTFRVPRPMPLGTFHPENRIVESPKTCFGKNVIMRFARIARLVEENRFAALDTMDTEIATLLALYLASTGNGPGLVPGSVERIMGIWSRFASRIEAVKHFV